MISNLHTAIALVSFGAIAVIAGLVYNKAKRQYTPHREYDEVKRIYQSK